VSRDDKALGLSSFLARGGTRLGALDPTKEPYSSMLQQARVNVVDLTSVASSDAANHSKFATGEVVAAIGARLAEGQTLTDAKPGLVESLGTFTRGAVGAAADVATGAVTAPTRLVDPTLQEKSVDTAEGSATLQ
jgi:esterase/lipase superfamily enzyme